MIVCSCLAITDEQIELEQLRGRQRLGGLLRRRIERGNDGVEQRFAPWAPRNDSSDRCFEGDQRWSGRG